MEVDIDFVGEATSSVKAAERLDLSLKHLAKVAVEVSKALADVELPTSNVAKTVAAAKTMERSLNSLENQAQRTKRQVAEVSLVQSGLPTIGGLGGRRFVAGPAGASVSASWNELARAMAQASVWIPKTKRELSQLDEQLLIDADLAKLASERMKNIKFAPGQVARNRAESKMIAEGVENIGDAAKRSKRQIAEMMVLDRLALAGRRGGGFGGGGGRGSDSFLFGRAGSGASTQSLGAIVPGGAKATGPALLAAVSLGVTAIAPLLPAVSSSLAAIPALATAGVGAIATLALAFHGLGKAIDGDKKAFDALDPQAQKFVQTIRSIIPWVHSLSHIALHELAPALTKALHEALSPAMIGTIERGIQSMAKALGVAAVQWGKLFGSAGFSASFGALLQAGAHWMQQLSDATMHFFDAMVHLGEAAIPFVDWMMKGIDQGARLLDTWIKGAQASGQLTRSINAGKEAFRLLVGLIVALSKALFQLMVALAPAGRLIDEALVSALTSMAGWLEKNRQAIIAITTGAISAFIGTLKVLGPILNGLFQALNKVVTALGGWTDAFRVLIGLGIARMISGIASSIVLKLVPAEILAGETAMGLAGPWGIILGLTAAILVTWLQIVDAINNAGTATQRQFASGGAASHKFSSPAQQADYQTYAEMRAIAANPNRSKSDRAKASTVAGDLGKQNPSFANEYAKDNAARAVKDNRPRAHVATSGIHKGQVVYTTKGGQEVLAKPGTEVGAILPGSVSTPGAPTASTKGVSWRGQVAGLDGGFKNKLATAVKAAGGTAVNVSSGKRSDAKHPGGPPNGGVPNSNHLTGHAADGHALIRGQWVPLGQMPINYSKYGLRSGDQPGFYQGARDPSHVDDGSNVGGPGTTDPFTTAPAFSTNLGPKPTGPASAASRSAAARAARNDIIAAGGFNTRYGILAAHSVAHTIDDPNDMLAGVTASATVGGGVTAREIGLRKKIAADRAKLAADEALLEGHKKLTNKQVAMIRERDRKLRDEINHGTKEINAAIKTRATQFKAAWQTLTDQALASFDDQTDKILTAFDKAAAKFKTPTEALIESLQSARTERDLKQAIEDAQKNLDDALAGLSGDTAQATLDRVTEVIARYGMAMAIDKAQAAILGGGTMNFGPDFLKELQAAATPGAGAVADPAEIAKARQALGDAVEDYRIYKLEPIAQAEREAQDEKDAEDRKQIAKEREALRKALNDQLAIWGTYWASVGANAQQAWALFDQVWFSLTGQHLPPLPGAKAGGAAGGGTSSAGATGPYTQAAAAAVAGGYGGYVNAPGATESIAKAANTGGAGAAAVNAAAGSNVLTNKLGSIWDVNQPTQTSAINSAATGGGSITITEGDPNGPAKAIDAASRGVPYSIQVNGDANDTPETLAAKINAAKAAYPGASSITLDLESANFRGGPGSPGWNANQGFAAAANAAAGDMPLIISTEAVSDFNYGAFATNPKTTFAPQAYWGNMDPRDVSTVVAILTAAGIDPSKIVPIIGPNQSVGNYGGPVSVFGSPAGGTSLAGAAPGGLTPVQAQNVAATAKAIEAGGTTITPSIAAAIVAAATTTEAPAQMYRSPGGGGIRMMAEGGILTKPTLMVGGERGREAVIPLGDPRAKKMLGGDTDPIELHINVGDGMEWLADYIQVGAMRASDAIARKQGKSADTRSRELRR